MDRGRAWRIATGAMLLAAGAPKLLPPATNVVALAFGGALLGASLGARPAPAMNWGPHPSEQSLSSPVTPHTVPYSGAAHTHRHAYGALALAMTLGAGLLVAYPWLFHADSPRSQASHGGAPLGATIGHAIPPKVDPQLHLIGLGQQFVLNQARVTIEAANVCRLGANVLVDVPAVISALHPGVTVAEPEYQLLDAHGAPYLPQTIVPLNVHRGTGQHAAPPPSPYRESIDFRLPAAATLGALKLQAVLASGSGPEYRVIVAGANQQLSPSSDGRAACISPGGQGV
jgi:hypothetical protein